MNRRQARIIALEVAVGVLDATYIGESVDLSEQEIIKVEREFEDIQRQIRGKLERAQATREAR